MKKEKLLEILKEAGLDFGEDVAIMTLKKLVKVIKRLIQESENKTDDLLIPLLDLGEKQLLELLDSIVED